MGRLFGKKRPSIWLLKFKSIVQDRVFFQDSSAFSFEVIQAWHLFQNHQLDLPLKTIKDQQLAHADNPSKKYVLCGQIIHKNGAKLSNRGFGLVNKFIFEKSIICKNLIISPFNSTIIISQVCGCNFLNLTFRCLYTYPFIHASPDSRGCGLIRQIPDYSRPLPTNI